MLAISYVKVSFWMLKSKDILSGLECHHAEKFAVLVDVERQIMSENYPWIWKSYHYRS